jgi:hypothetical protein
VRARLDHSTARRRLDETPACDRHRGLAARRNGGRRCTFSRVMMTTISQLRARARRYRELAESHTGDAAEGLRQAADGVDRQADALEAYQAADRLTRPHALAITA